MHSDPVETKSLQAINRAFAEREAGWLREVEQLRQLTREHESRTDALDRSLLAAQKNIAELEQALYENELRKKELHTQAQLTVQQSAATTRELESLRLTHRETLSEVDGLKEQLSYVNTAHVRARLRLLLLRESLRNQQQGIERFHRSCRTVMERLGAAPNSRPWSWLVRPLRLGQELARLNDLVEIELRSNSKPGRPPAAAYVSSPPPTTAAALRGTGNTDPVHELLSLFLVSVDDFVDRAYLLLLGRPPDPSGRTFYRARLDEGIPRFTVVRELSSSNEALEKARRFAELEELSGLEHRLRPRLLGRLRRLSIAGASMDSIAVVLLMTRLHRDRLVMCAYELILGRKPDPQGYEAYLECLQEGLSKSDFLAALLCSPEYRSSGRRSLLLERQMMLRRLARLPLFSKLIVSVLPWEGMSRCDIQMRKVEQRQLVVEEQQGQLLTRLLALVNTVDDLKDRVASASARGDRELDAGTSANRLKRLKDAL